MTDLKKEFIEIFTQNIKRVGAGKLLDWLEKSDFFTAPASTKYHSCHEGGLVEHSLNVYHRLRNSIKDGDDESVGETIAICGLLHDICKANFYAVSMRNTKNEAGQWVKEPYYTIDEKFPFGHGEKSVFIIERFMKLTSEEAIAIRFHMGDFTNDRSTSAAYEQCTLAVMLHVADLEATYLDEERGA